MLVKLTQGVVLSSGVIWEGWDNPTPVWKSSRHLAAQAYSKPNSGATGLCPKCHFFVQLDHSEFKCMYSFILLNYYIKLYLSNASFKLKDDKFEALTNFLVSEFVVLWIAQYVALFEFLVLHLLTSI